MTTSSSFISHNFFANGTPAIDATHMMERRLAEAESRRLIASARRNASGTGLRHMVGTMIISVGAVIAGTTTNIQDRQATMPDPTPKSGFVPTR